MLLQHQHRIHHQQQKQQQQPKQQRTPRSGRGLRSALCATRLLDAADDDKDVAALRAAASLVLADLCRRPVRGLAASTPLCKGDAVLLLPTANALSVPDEPSARSVYRWECEVLEPFEAAHGALPPSLAFFIADMEQPAVARLVAWLLHMRNGCQQQARLSTIWHSWFSLLPLLSEATSPGSWTTLELQQLQLTPLQAVMACDNAAHQAYAASLHAALPGLVPGLQASSVADVLWALFVVKTRSIASPGRLNIFPLHDLLNHSEQPNCQTAFKSQGGLSVTAVRPVAAGEELTINYAPPEGLSSLGFLTSWGFCPGLRPEDAALPLTVHALPPLSWQLVVSAAAAAAAADEADGSAGQQQRHSQQALLAAAVGCLPVRLPATGGAHAALYAAAAQLIQRHASCSTSKLCAALQAADAVQQAAGQHHGSCALQAYTHPDTFRQASVAPTALATMQHLHQPQQLRVISRGAAAQLSADELSLQQAVAAALFNECQGALLQCTTAEQDEALLQQEASKAQVGSRAAVNPGAGGLISRAVQDQQLLLEFLQLQEQVMQQLIVLQASRESSQAGQQISRAAKTVLQTLQQQQQQQRAQDVQQQQQALGQVRLAQQRQETLLQLLHAATDDGADAVAGVSVELLASAAGLSKARLATAVTARLQQKRLLLAVADVCAAARALMLL